MPRRMRPGASPPGPRLLDGLARGIHGLLPNVAAGLHSTISLLFVFMDLPDVGARSVLCVGPGLLRDVPALSFAIVCAQWKLGFMAIVKRLLDEGRYF